MPTGLFRELPPGLSGWVAAEQMADRRGANALNQAQGIFGLQQAMEAAPIQREIMQLQLQQMRNPALKPRGPMIVPKGATVLGENNEPIFTPAPEVKEPRPARTHFDAERGVIIDLDTGKVTTPPGVGPKPKEPKSARTHYDAERGVIINLDTGEVTTPPGLAPKADKALTEAQGNATMFGMRAVEMDATLKGMQKGSVDPQTGAVTPPYDPTGFGGLKDRLAAGTLTGNWAASAEGQKYINAGRNFVAAILRKESGAQITEAEWKQGQELYIPMPGDNRQVIEQKEFARGLAIKGLREAAGTGSTRIPGQPIIPPGTPMPGYGRREGDRLRRNPDGSFTYTP